MSEPPSLANIRLKRRGTDSTSACPSTRGATARLMARSVSRNVGYRTNSTVVLPALPLRGPDSILPNGAIPPECISVPGLHRGPLGIQEQSVSDHVPSQQLGFGCRLAPYNREYPGCAMSGEPVFREPHP